MPTEGVTAEPRSLRRLRESLSSLEQLERRRKELREKWDERVDDTVPSAFGLAKEVEEHADRLKVVSASSASTSLGLLGRDTHLEEDWPTSSYHRDSSYIFAKSARAEPTSVLRSVYDSDELDDSWQKSTARHRTSSRPPLEQRLYSEPRASSSSAVPRASDYSRLKRASQEADDALALSGNTARSQLVAALEKAQERIAILKRERDDALYQRDRTFAKAASQEADLSTLSMQLERAEADHRGLLEERVRESQSFREEHRKEAAENARLRQDLLEANERIAALEAMEKQTRTSTEEWRDRYDRLSIDQRQQVDTWEDTVSRASRELNEQRRLAGDFGESLYRCLHERDALLHFVLDLLTALQSLFYEPTSFATIRLPARSSSSNMGGAQHGGPPSRSRSCSAERYNMHAGLYGSGYVPSRSPNAKNVQKELRDGGTGDLRQVAEDLAYEVGEASQGCSALVQRVVAECERSARVLGLPVRSLGSASGDRFLEVPSALEGDRLGAGGDRGMLRTCLEWIADDRRRREIQGIPPDSMTPLINWGGERSEWQANTRVMETKFEQLTRLKRVIQSKQHALRRARSGMK
eukprot:TRINITY_DN111170_c0_g1_i1.p1 TRINITY_DN111170_c0_g1~~TRINITY_DN111170_c0_g1_i1.p1  ORF type:complete len:584 (+),score=104.38 TRINITY_DN111170_c0_g1_i1:120-1871(+)